jgi:hypothetical protein
MTLAGAYFGQQYELFYQLSASPNKLALLKLCHSLITNVFYFSLEIHQNYPQSYPEERKRDL